MSCGENICGISKSTVTGSNRKSTAIGFLRRITRNSSAKYMAGGWEREARERINTYQEFKAVFQVENYSATTTTVNEESIQERSKKYHLQ